MELDEDAAREIIRGLAARPGSSSRTRSARPWASRCGTLTRGSTASSRCATASRSTSCASRPQPGQYGDAEVQLLIDTFEREYELLYGQGSGYPAAGFMITALRVSARAAMTSRELAGGNAGEPYDVEPSGRRDVVWYELDATPRPTAVYDGGGLRPGARVAGPAIVEFVDTTLVLRHGQAAVVDPWSSIVIDA
jgi:N-methylhydantoinase A/oxoprolinase/acetone carboxylase beta subunit